MAGEGIDLSRPARGVWPPPVVTAGEVLPGRTNGDETSPVQPDCEEKGPAVIV